MLRRIGQIRRIKSGEGMITGLMASYIAGVLAFYYILKPMRSALFLKDLPARDLPNAYLLTALLAGPLITLVFKFSRRLSILALLTWTNLGVIGSLLLLCWAVAAHIRYLPYAFFAYVQIVSVLCVAQFWLFAGHVFDGRQAKRIYGILGAGAITGSIVGSLITDLLKDKSMTAMLGICIGICLALIALAHLIRRCGRSNIDGAYESHKGFESSGLTPREMLRTVFGSRLLQLMVLLMLLTIIASQIADWQLDYAAQERFKHLPPQLQEQEIKSFRARLNWVTNLVGIGIQLSVTQFVVQRVGIWAAVLFLPIGLGAASFGVLFAPSLRSATIAVGCDSVFRYSINRTGFELFFLPLSSDTRRKVKLFIDVFADRVGRAAAAFIILALTTRYLPLGLTGTAVAVAALTVSSLLVGLKMRGSYVDAFRQQLIRREVNLSEVSRYVADPTSLGLLASTLESPHERQILYSLSLLKSARAFDFSPQLLPLLQHRSALVREEAVRTLHALPRSHDADAERLLQDESEDVRKAAIEYLCLNDPARTNERLRKLFDHANPDIRLAAGRCAASLPESVFRPSMDLVSSLMALDGARAIQAHEVAARLAARLPEIWSVPLLHRFLLDPRRQVATGAIAAAGKAGRLELVSDIVPLLSDKSLRSASQQALVSIGPKITANLAAVLGDESRDPAIRQEIPWILSSIQDRQAARALVDNLNAADLGVKYQIVKALSRMHAHNSDLPGNQPLINVHTIAQIMAYYEGLALCQPFRGKEETAAVDGFVGRALRERLDRQLEMAFRLLGLSYPQKDIYFAYAALKGLHKGKRISAIEFLDNILGKDVKPLILPLLEEEMPERLLARAAHFFGLRVPGRNEALSTLLQQPDPWLRACSLYAVGSDRITELEPPCRQLAQDRDARVREMADWAIDRMSSKNADGLFHADKY